MTDIKFIIYVLTFIMIYKRMFRVGIEQQTYCDIFLPFSTVLQDMTNTNGFRLLFQLRVYVCELQRFCKNHDGMRKKNVYYFFMFIYFFHLL